MIHPLLAFLNAQSLTEMRQSLEANPPLLTDAVEPVLDELFEQYKDDERALQMLAFKRQVLRDCREHEVEVVFGALATAQQVPPELAAFAEAVNNYQTLRQAAAEHETDVDGWRRVVKAGEALLAPRFANLPDVDWDALRDDVASAYNMLGNAHSEVGNHEDAINAYNHAIALHEIAMWYRNKAGVLIDMNKLDEAAAAIERARALEPDAPRLAESDMALARAREGKGPAM